MGSLSNPDLMYIYTGNRAKTEVNHEKEQGNKVWYAFSLYSRVSVIKY